MARRMTRKILDEKAATFNSLFEKSPGVTVQAGFQCYNIITIDPETRRQYGSELSVYGLTNWEAAHYLDGLIHTAGYIRNIDYSNPYRQMSAGVLTENAKQFFRNKTGIIVFKTGGYSMTILSFSLRIHCGAGSFEVSIEYDKKEWNIKKL